MSTEEDIHDWLDGELDRSMPAPKGMVWSTKVKGFIYEPYSSNPLGTAPVKQPGAKVYPPQVKTTHAQRRKQKREHLQKSALERTRPSDDFISFLIERDAGAQKDPWDD